MVILLTRTSGRVIIAGPREVYISLGGIPADSVDWSKHLKKSCDDEPPSKKQKLPEPNDNPLEQILDRLDKIDRRTKLFEDLKKAFECCICKATCRKPLVSSCCGRIVGCRACVDLTASRRCPLCRAISEQRFELKGFSSLLSIFQNRRSSFLNSRQPVSVTYVAMMTLICQDHSNSHMYGCTVSLARFH